MEVTKIMKFGLKLLCLALCTVIISTVCVVFVSAGQFGNEVPQIIRIYVKDKDKLSQLASKGLDITEVKSNYSTAIVTQKEIWLLKSLGISYDVVNKDANSIMRNLSYATKDSYHTYEQTEKILKDTVAQYPQICQLSTIGKSTEGRDIYALKITSDIEKNEKKPQTLITGLHHAREWISAEVPIQLIIDLTTNYSKDSSIKTLLDSVAVQVVPIVNPDGYVYSQTKEMFWRKNRATIKNKQYGVDLNRNYGYKWGGPGASKYPSSETYMGPSAFSEPCTQAIRDLAQKEGFRTAINFHSYSELILYPYGYADFTKAPDNSLFKEMASDMSKINKYSPMKSSDLYITSGDSDDYLYGAAGIIPFTIELGTSFIPDANEVNPICSSNIKVCKYLMEKSKSVKAKNFPANGT
jgi:carboxypeptidase T